MYVKKLLRWLIFIIGFCSFIITFNFAQSDKTVKIDNETVKVMPFVKDNSSCLECHSSNELEAKGNDLTKSCNTFCNKCHNEKLDDSHHKVGMEISFKIPPDIALFENKLACVSCHDLKNQRFSKEPWKSQSLFGRMFKGKSKYKSYYLILNNRKGKLCKYCH